MEGRVSPAIFEIFDRSECFSGTEFKAGETVKVVPSAPKLPEVIMPTAAARKNVRVEFF